MVSVTSSPSQSPSSSLRQRWRPSGEIPAGAGEQGCEQQGESQCGVRAAALPTWLRPGNLLTTFPLARRREQHKSFSTLGCLQTQFWGFGGLFSSCRQERTDPGITWATLGPPEVCSLAETAGGSRRRVSWGRIDRSRSCRLPPL